MNKITCEICGQTLHKNDVDVTLCGLHYWHKGEDGLIHCMGNIPKPTQVKWGKPYQLSYTGRRNIGDYEKH